MKSAFFFNLNFEEQLLTGQTNDFVSNHYSQEFEYLLFYLGIGPIFTKKKYPEEFLKQFKLPLQMIINSHELNIIPFWGHFQNLQLARKLNSKIESFKIAQKIFPEIDDSFTIIDPILQPIDKTQNVYRTEYSFSGKKIHQATKRMIQTKKLKRILDFSTLHLGHGKFFSYQNKINDHYAYVGSLIDSNFDFDNYWKKINVESDQWIKFQNFIYSFHQELINLGMPIDEIYSVDSFLYLDSFNQNQIYYFCEVNYRKTMGYMAYMIGREIKISGPYTFELHPYQEGSGAKSYFLGEFELHLFLNKNLNCKFSHLLFKLA